MSIRIKFTEPVERVIELIDHGMEGHESNFYEAIEILPDTQEVIHTPETSEDYLSDFLASELVAAFHNNADPLDALTTLREAVEEGLNILQSVQDYLAVATFAIRGEKPPYERIFPDD